MFKTFSPLSGYHFFENRYCRGGCLPPLRSSAVSIPSPQTFLSIFIHVFESHNLVCIGNHFKRLLLELLRWGGVNTVIGVIHNSLWARLLISISLNVGFEQFVTRRDQNRWDYLNWPRTVQVVAQSATLKNLKYKLSSNIFCIRWSFYWQSRGFYWYSEPGCLTWTPGNHCLWSRFLSEVSLLCSISLCACQIW